MKAHTLAFLISLLFISNTLFGTSIIPFSNLGKMAEASPEVLMATVVNESEIYREGVIFTQIELVVKQSIKGSLSEGEHFKIEKWSRKGENWLNMVAGDVELNIHQNYLLFLEPYMNVWRPLMLSHNVHEEIIVDDKALLVPIEESSKMSKYSPEDGSGYEEEAVYYKDRLIQLIDTYLSNNITWDRNEALFTTDVEEFTSKIELRSAPTHCAYLLAGGIGVRWENFPGTNLPVRYPTADDTDCLQGVSANAFVNTALTNMNNNYPDISMSDGGVHTYTPDCSSNPPSARLGNYISWVNSNMGGGRNEMIIFNDPCNEISNLSGCNGTLAIGGAYAFGPATQFNGEDWYSAAYGYVIINNDVCTCLNQSDYELVLAHEMTHSLGLAHINSTHGQANMNGTCCENISNLDKVCVAFEYSPVFPVELESFTGLKNEKSVDLKWTTASELNSASFFIERSSDALNYTKIGIQQAAGNSIDKLNYQFRDKNPLLGANYYRLIQLDLNGKSEVLGKILHFSFDNYYNELNVIPNPVKENYLSFNYSTTEAESADVLIFDAKGTLLLTKQVNLNKGQNEINLEMKDLNSGVYLLQLRLKNTLYKSTFSVID